MAHAEVERSAHRETMESLELSETSVSLLQYGSTKLLFVFFIKKKVKLNFPTFSYSYSMKQAFIVCPTVLDAVTSCRCITGHA